MVRCEGVRACACVLSTGSSLPKLKENEKIRKYKQFSKNGSNFNLEWCACVVWVLLPSCWKENKETQFRVRETIKLASKKKKIEKSKKNHLSITVAAHRQQKTMANKFAHAQSRSKEKTWQQKRAETQSLLSHLALLWQTISWCISFFLRLFLSFLVSRDEWTAKKWVVKPKFTITPMNLATVQLRFYCENSVSLQF